MAGTTFLKVASFVLVFASWVLVFGSFGYIYRNKRVIRPHNPSEILVEEVRNMETKFFFCARRVKHTSGKFPIKIRWKKPKPNWIKLNTDGLALDILGLAGNGDIIKDHNGTWVARFASAISIATSIEAKLWVFQDVLIICLTLGIQSLEIELDVKVVVEWVSSQSHSIIAHSHSSLIVDYRSLVSQFLKVQIKHCYREANQCISVLTRFEAKLEQDFIIYDFLLWRSICCCFKIFLACILRGLSLTLFLNFPPK